MHFLNLPITKCPCDQFFIHIFHCVKFSRHYPDEFTVTQYAKAQDEEEIPDEDIDLINPALNSDEVAILEQKGLGLLLGELGEHMAKGTAPSAKRPSNSTALPVPPEKKDVGPAKVPGETKARLSPVVPDTIVPESDPSAESRGKRRGHGLPRLPKSLFFRRSCRGSIFFLYALASQ
jgi:hypothetical protein